MRKLPQVKTKYLMAKLPSLLKIVAFTLAIGFLSWQKYWVIAALLVVAIELWSIRSKINLDKIFEILPNIVMGVSIVIVVSITPKALTQIVILVFFAGWRYWIENYRDEVNQLATTLVILAFAFQAIFLASAIWHLPHLLVLALTWFVIYCLAYQALRTKGEVSAKLMASVWALVGAEAAWLFVTWQVSYILPNSYLIVPQAVLVLTALGYVFGSIFMAQRRSELSKSRLTEYLVIGAILIAIVIAGTPWRGTI